MLNLQQCLHTTLLVTDLEKATYFYSGVLGLPPVERALNFPGIWYQVGNYQIHLIVAPNFTPSEPNPEKWGRNPHLAFSTPDLDGAIATLKAKGYPLQMSASGRRAIFVKDPDGNILEISEM
jgi:catechol 2,3-dioxygenase-like lactoylglutathione lyase family enzyme